MGPRHDQMCQTLSRYNWHNTQSKKARAEGVQRHSLWPTTLETPRKWGSNPNPSACAWLSTFISFRQLSIIKWKRKRAFLKQSFQSAFLTTFPDGESFCVGLFGVCMVYHYIWCINKFNNLNYILYLFN